VARGWAREISHRGREHLPGAPLNSRAELENQQGQQVGHDGDVQLKIFLFSFLFDFTY
jgi:hypothetical protein